MGRKGELELPLVHHHEGNEKVRTEGGGLPRLPLLLCRPVPVSAAELHVVPHWEMLGHKTGVVTGAPGRLVSKTTVAIGVQAAGFTRVYICTMGSCTPLHCLEIQLTVNENGSVAKRNNFSKLVWFSVPYVSTTNVPRAIFVHCTGFSTTH